MAVRAFTTFIPLSENGMNVTGAIAVKWTGLANGDTGAPYVCPNRSEKAVQVYGTFGAGGNCKLEGTNDQAYDANGADAISPAPTYATLNDQSAASLDIAAASIKAVLENPNAIRPRASAGDGTTALTVIVIISSTARL